MFLSSLAAIVLLITVTATTGCNSPKEMSESSVKYVLEKESLVYFKDSRTKLCFAYMWSGDGFGGPAMTHVPCTEEVENHVEAPEQLPPAK